MRQKWPLVRLGDVLLRRKDGVDVEDDKEYTRLTIRMNGQGVDVRDKTYGREIGTKRQFKVKAGQFLLSKIDARNGAFGVIPSHCHDAIVTGNFWAFDISSDKVISGFIDQLAKTTFFVDYSIKASSGTTNRRYLQEEKFVEQQIELPPIEVQKQIVSKIDTIKDKLQAASALQEGIDKDVDNLLAERFQATLKTAAWRPMREAAPLLRREVMIASDATYTELGVRSFFKGAFVRRTVPGEEFTWQKLFRVNSDDLIFSNIMAWEKGIALALPIHDGCVGNHRMLTCEARPEIALSTYLHHYFTTEDGFSRVYAASPGTAARNRTLTADALMAIEVPTPPISVQKQFVALKNKLVQVAIERTKQKKLTEALIPSMLSKLLTT